MVLYVHQTNSCFFFFFHERFNLTSFGVILKIYILLLLFFQFVIVFQIHTAICVFQYNFCFRSLEVNSRLSSFCIEHLQMQKLFAFVTLTKGRVRLSSSASQSFMNSPANSVSYLRKQSQVSFIVIRKKARTVALDFLGFLVFLLFA